MSATNVHVMPIESCEISYRKQELRDSVVYMAWLKLTCTICFIVMYYFVYTTSKGDCSLVIQIMLLIATPLHILQALILFYGAIEKKPWALEISLWLCLALASYDTVLGILGAVFFVRIGHEAIHFVLVVSFILLALSLFIVLCHDILVIFAYKQMLLTFPELNDLSSSSTDLKCRKL